LQFNPIIFEWFFKFIPDDIYIIHKKIFNLKIHHDDESEYHDEESKNNYDDFHDKCDDDYDNDEKVVGYDAEESDVNNGNKKIV
jgi:hypothetical protein